MAASKTVAVRIQCPDCHAELDLQARLMVYTGGEERMRDAARKMLDARGTTGGKATTQTHQQAPRQRLDPGNLDRSKLPPSHAGDVCACKHWRSAHADRSGACVNCACTEFTTT